MNMYKYLPLIFITLFTFPVAAAARPPADVENINVRLEIIESPAPPAKNIFSAFRSWLGSRVLTPPYPELGTTFIVAASGYAPSPYQTDSTPCITAAGTRVRKGTVASNFLPLGTILEINGEKYIVEDRINPRYKKKAIDIFFVSTSEALEFGRRTLKVTIVEYGKPGQSIIDPPPSTQHLVAAPDLPGFKDRVKGQFYFVRRLASEFIGTRSQTDVNRYDVDCLNEKNN